jgi:hypothetical protein
VAQEPQIRPRSPEPSRVPVRTWPTPNATDLLFYVEKDGNLAVNQAAPAPKSWAYGDPYFDQKNFPNHKLVYVSPQSAEQWSRWYYAANRENQDEYNWSHSVADLGGTKFSSVERSYLTLRSEYDPLVPTMGTVMADVPKGKFEETFIMAYRKEVRVGEAELDSLYVAEQRTFIKRVTITEIGIRQRTGKGEFDVTTLFYKGEVVPGVTPETPIEALVADQTNAYWGAQPDGSFRGVNEISENWYAVTHRVFLDLEPGYKKTASRLKPSQFFCPQATSSTTSIVVTTEGTPADPAPNLGEEITVEKTGLVESTTTTVQQGSPQPLPGLNALDDGYAYPTIRTLVLTSAVPSSRQGVDGTGKITEYQAVDPCNSVSDQRQLVSPETEYQKTVERLAPPKFYVQGLVSSSDVVSFNGAGAPATPTAALNEQIRITVKGKLVHTATTSQAGDPVPVLGTSFDERTGATFFETQEVVLQGDVVEGSIGADGYLVTFQGDDANFALKDTRKIVDPTSITYYDVVNYEWPPVLLSITLTEWTARNSRGPVIYPDYTVKKGFSGPQIATVVQFWQKDPYTPAPPVQMIPEAMDFQSPLFSIGIPPCLHDETEFFCNIGTTDPQWEPQSYSKTFDATNFVDWPDTITWEAVQPYRGGYLVTSYTLAKPA